jgi:hypothetical protein
VSVVSKGSCDKSTLWADSARYIQGRSRRLSLWWSKLRLLIRHVPCRPGASRPPLSRQ